MLDGRGDPSGKPYEESVGQLYTVAFTLKFLFKKERDVDYPVMGLEGLWWADDFGDFAAGRRENWKWTIFLVVPDIVTEKDLALAVAQVLKKGKFASLPAFRVERFHEGPSAQVLHVGPYANERPTVQRLHQFIAEQGYRMRGRHHEIYLGDPRRTAPERLRTIIRQPVEKAGPASS